MGRRGATVGLAMAASAMGGLSGCGDGAALDRLVEGPRIQVVAVGSGDALTAKGGGRFRLAGVEAPQGEAPYAAQSRAALARLVLGRELELTGDGAPDAASGEHVVQARTTQGRRWIQGALLDAGAVRVRVGREDRAMTASMLLHEAAARRARRGLWADPAYRVRLPAEVDSNDRGLMLVEGRVWRVDRTGDGVELALADAGPDELSARIGREALREFRTLRLDPGDLQGRLVRVRGEAHVDADHRWIDVDVPEQIEPIEAAAPTQARP